MRCDSPKLHNFSNFRALSISRLNTHIGDINLYKSHFSQFQSLCLTKSSSETLQNLPYFILMGKTQSYFFCFSICANLIHFLMNSIVYVGIDQGIRKGKSKVAGNGKWKKQLWVCVYIKYGKF